MAGVDVYKNPSAEQTEGGISGLVNLRTALPFDFKERRGALSVEATHSTPRKGKPDPSVSGLFSNRWKTGFGEFGALVDIASSNSSTQTDTFQFEPLYPRTGPVPWYRASACRCRHPWKTPCGPSSATSGETTA